MFEINEFHVHLLLESDSIVQVPNFKFVKNGDYLEIVGLGADYLEIVGLGGALEDDVGDFLADLLFNNTSKLTQPTANNT